MALRRRNRPPGMAIDDADAGSMLAPSDSASQQADRLPPLYATKRRDVQIHTEGSLGFGCFPYPGHGLVICELALGGYMEAGGIFQIGDVLIAANQKTLAHDDIHESLRLIKEALPDVLITIEGYVKPEDVHLLEHEASDSEYSDSDGIVYDRAGTDGDHSGSVSGSMSGSESDGSSNDSDAYLSAPKRLHIRSVPSNKKSSLYDLARPGHGGAAPPPPRDALDRAKLAGWIVGVTPFVLAATCGLLLLAIVEGMCRYSRNWVYWITGPHPVPPLSGENVFYDVIMHIWYVTVFEVADGGLKQDLAQSTHEGGVVLTAVKAEVLGGGGRIGKHLKTFRGTRIIHERVPTTLTANNIAQIIEGRAAQKSQSRNIFQPGVDEDRAPSHIPGENQPLFDNPDEYVTRIKPMPRRAPILDVPGMSHTTLQTRGESEI